MQANAVDLQRYADALVAAGAANGSVERIETELEQVLDLLDRNDVGAFIADPLVASEGKAAVLKDTIPHTFEPALTHFVLMLFARGHLSRLGKIAELFYQRASSLRRKAAGTLATAYPLYPEMTARIEAEVGEVLGKEVHLRVREDRSLLGGVRVQVGDFVMDDTVERRLEDMRRQLADGG